MPTAFEASLPSATEIVEQSFDFATQVHDAEWDITLRLIYAVGVTRPTAAGKQAD